MRLITRAAFSTPRAGRPPALTCWWSNHALLMADVAVRQETGYSSAAILPPFERLIFDEGHHLEDVATGYTSSQTSRAGLLRISAGSSTPAKTSGGSFLSSPHSFPGRCRRHWTTSTWRRPACWRQN